MLNLTELEKAYLAGLFDGEGSIGYYNSKPYLTITNTDARIFNWIKQRISIGIIKTRSRVGSLGKKPTWEWSVRNKLQVVLVLEAIRPYLIIKVDQVDLLLSLWDAEKLARCGKNRKVPEHIIQQRQVTEAGLKRMKTTITQSIH